MKELDKFNLLGRLDEDIILGSVPPSMAAGIGESPKKKRRLLRAVGQFFDTGWGIAAACAVVSIGVLAAVVAAGRMTPGGVTPPVGGSLGGTATVTDEPTTLPEWGTLPDSEEIDPEFSYPGETGDGNDGESTTAEENTTPALPPDYYTDVDMEIIDPGFTFPDSITDPKPEIEIPMEPTHIATHTMTATDSHGQTRTLTLRWIRLAASASSTVVQPAGIYMDIVDADSSEILHHLLYLGDVSVFSMPSGSFGVLSFTPHEDIASHPASGTRYPYLVVSLTSVWVDATSDGSFALTERETDSETFSWVEPTVIADSQPDLSWRAFRNFLEQSLAPYASSPLILSTQTIRYAMMQSGIEVAPYTTVGDLTHLTQLNLSELFRYGLTYWTGDE